MRVPRPGGKVAVVLAAVAAVLAALAAVALPGPAKISQPIAFSHKIHAGKDIDCSYCHEHVENSPKATLPSNRVCLGCHETAKGKDPEEPKVCALAALGPIPWVRVNRLVGHVYFSHRAHVTFGNLECKQCHGDMAELNEPLIHSQLAHLSMTECIRCHQERHARTDCLTCHK